MIVGIIIGLMVGATVGYVFCTILLANRLSEVRDWISIEEKLPASFVSVLGYMTEGGLLLYLYEGVGKVEV